MLSMTLASLGWATWWIVLLVRKLAPGVALGIGVPAAISTVFALLGLAVAVLTLRARRSWILFVTVPLVANATLLLVPWLAGGAWKAAPPQ